MKLMAKADDDERGDVPRIIKILGVDVDKSAMGVEQRRTTGVDKKLQRLYYAGCQAAAKLS